MFPSPLPSTLHFSSGPVLIPTLTGVWQRAISWPATSPYPGDCVPRVPQHGMHVILDLHGLPGGVNNRSIGERMGGMDWWYNESALEWSMKTVNTVLDFIRPSGHPAIRGRSHSSRSMSPWTNRTISGSK